MADIESAERVTAQKSKTRCFFADFSLQGLLPNSLQTLCFFAVFSLLPGPWEARAQNFVQKGPDFRSKGHFFRPGGSGAIGKEWGKEGFALLLTRFHHRQSPLVEKNVPFWSKIRPFLDKILCTGFPGARQQQKNSKKTSSLQRVWKQSPQQEIGKKTTSF